jgi:hypothetical protein
MSSSIENSRSGLLDAQLGGQGQVNFIPPRSEPITIRQSPTGHRSIVQRVPTSPVGIIPQPTPRSIIRQVSENSLGSPSLNSGQSSPNVPVSGSPGNQASGSNLSSPPTGLNMHDLLDRWFATEPISRQTSEYEPPVRQRRNSSLTGSVPSLPSSTPTRSPTGSVLLNSFAPAPAGVALASSTSSLTQLLR